VITEEIIGSAGGGVASRVLDSIDDLPWVQQFLDFVTEDGSQEMILGSGLYPARQVDSMSSDS